MLRIATMLAAAVAAAPALAKDFAPRDECAGIAGVADFRTELNSAVAARDDDAFLALVSEDILLDFGGGSGHDELRARLKNPEYGLWDELAAIMPWGCATDDGTLLTMPWFFNQPAGEIDPFEGAIVTGTQVALRDGPTLSSNVLSRLSWTPVVIQYRELDPSEFRPVKTPDGLLGYVHRDYLRSFVDYRILAEEVDGKWQVTVFIAGD